MVFDGKAQASSGRMGKKLVQVREQESRNSLLIALRPLIINQASQVLCQGGFPASLIYVLLSLRLLCRFSLVIRVLSFFLLSSVISA